MPARHHGRALEGLQRPHEALDGPYGYTDCHTTFSSPQNGSQGVLMDTKPPTVDYILALVASMRDAAEKAMTARRAYEAREKDIATRVQRLWTNSKWMQDMPVSEHIKSAKNSDPTLKDLGKSHGFWSGEQVRFSALIQAEVWADAFIKESQ